MKLQSLILAIISVSIIVFNNLHQILTALVQPKTNSLLVTGFIMIILGTAVYFNYNRKKLKKGI